MVYLSLRPRVHCWLTVALLPVITNPGYSLAEQRASTTLPVWRQTEKRHSTTCTLDVSAWKKWRVLLYQHFMDHSKPCGHSLSSVAQRWVTSPLRIAYQEENKDIWATVIQPIVEVGKVNIQLFSWANGRHGENQCLVPWKQRISKAHVLLRGCLSGKILESSEGSKTRKGKRSKYLNLLMVGHI